MTYQFIERKELHQFHPIRKVTLVDGSSVHIDRVTGITCSLEEQLGKVEELQEKYKQRCYVEHQINDVFLEDDY